MRLVVFLFVVAVARPAAAFGPALLAGGAALHLAAVRTHLAIAAVEGIGAVAAAHAAGVATVAGLRLGGAGFLAAGAATVDAGFVIAGAAGTDRE